MDSGVIWRRHAGQIIITGERVDAQPEISVEIPVAASATVEIPVAAQATAATLETPELPAPDQADQAVPVEANQPSEDVTSATPQGVTPTPKVRRSTRVQKALTDLVGTTRFSGEEM
eukprot:m.300988 g.300988  ORF g.300988 m.300988 type:complete len:117 (+) comp40804_c0_seq14:3135-3485(+)